MGEAAAEVERRLAAGQSMFCVAAHGVCVRGAAGREHPGVEQVDAEAGLRADAGRAVVSLLSAGGRLFSWSEVCPVWDAAGGRCEGALEGHADQVASLAASGARLVSGSWDGTVRVWWVEGPGGVGAAVRAGPGRVACRLP